MAKIIKFVLIPLVLFLIFFIGYNQIYKQIPITFWDEEEWVGRGYFYELLVKGDFDSYLWIEDYGYDQPKMAEYLFGAVNYPKYLKAKKEKGVDYDYGLFLSECGFREIRGYKYPKLPVYPEYHTYWKCREGSMAEDLILSARRANIFLLSLNLILVYSLVLYVFGFIPAILTVILMGLNDFIITVNVVAHSESLFLFLFNLSLLLVFMIFFKKKERFWIYSLLGIVVGLLVQTKLNGLLVLLTFDILILGKLFIKKKPIKESLKVITFVFYVNLLSWSVFVVSNPYLYKAPLANTMYLYDYRNKAVQDQVKNFPDSALGAYPSRILSIYKSYFTRFRSQESSYVFKNRADFVNDIITFFMSPLLFLVGLFWSLRKTKSRLFIVVFIILQLITGLYLVLDWQRYYAHLALFFMAFSVVGLITVINLIVYEAKKWFGFSER